MRYILPGPRGARSAGPRGEPALCLYLMHELTVQTSLRFFGWPVVGLVLYFVYGRRHSRLQHGETVITDEA